MGKPTMGKSTQMGGQIANSIILFLLIYFTHHFYIHTAAAAIIHRGGGIHPSLSCEQLTLLIANCMPTNKATVIT